MTNQKKTDETSGEGGIPQQTRQDHITNSAKIFKVYTAKPIADAVKERLKRLTQSEQVKQNEDSGKEEAKLVKPITAYDKSTFKTPANCKEEYN